MKRLVRIFVPIAIVVGGIAAAIALIRSKPQARKTPPRSLGALVEVVDAHAERQQIEIKAYGNVIPARQVRLAPEVGGSVRWVHDRLVPGSWFKKGERLVRIDARDYSLAVEQQFAAVDRAKTELEIEHSRKRIAEREWQMFEGRQKTATATQPADPLALREPQLRTAKVAVEAAESGLRRARLAVAKATLDVPFNAMLLEKNVEIGQMVAPGTPMVTLVGTDAYWVQVAVPLGRLSWFDIPGIGGAAQGAEVEVVQKAGSEVVRRKGRVIRLHGEVDPAGRMARVLVQIDDPLGLAAPRPDAGTEAASDDNRLPLLLGAYVDVTIKGREAGDVVAIPREALRENDEVYVASTDNKLVKKKVAVLWGREDTVLLAGGLSEGDKVIVSPVPGAVDGMDIRLSTKAAAGESARSEGK